MNHKKSITVPPHDLFMLAKDSINKSGRFTFTARGYSMYPAICDGEKVTLESIDFKDLKIGDIVLCYTFDGPFLHRIVKKSYRSKDKYIIIKGDALFSKKHQVESYQIAGSVSYIFKRHKKRFKGFLKRRLLNIKNIKKKFN